MESCSAHAQMIEKFQSVFPNLFVPQISSTNSILDALDDMIRKIPRPNLHQRHDIISNMKNYVDGQQLRIQKNMIEIQEAQPIPLQCLIKKVSVETKDDEGQWHQSSVENVQNWGWERQDLSYHESLQHQFSAFID